MEGEDVSGAEVISKASIKQKRALKACDFCHRRGRRCKASPNDNTRCMTCIEYAVSCTWNRVSAKRGAKPRRSKVTETLWIFDESKHGSRSLITNLCDNFFESVYPVAAIIHEQTFMDHWHRDKIPCDRPSYARLMAVCALSATRITSGATFQLRNIQEHFEPNFYLNEALQAVSGNVSESFNLESLQAVGVICLTALEAGNTFLLQRYMGMYHAALAEQGFHDERRWPDDISIIEKEERRRLYWYMYRLEVHTSLVLGHAVRCPELHSAVAYPSLPDQDFTESIRESEWLSGWNFITDIYRGMEHVIPYFRSRRAIVNRANRKLSTAFLYDYDPQEKIVEPLALALSNLPSRFKHAFAVSRDTRQNRCAFQTANIICTYHLLRILSFCANDGTLFEACRTALDLIEEISAIPHQYMRAMGLSMLQELSGLGHILSSFVKKELRRSDYQHLRTVM
ncbi:hypothetical protein, variant 1 [Exophiala mesophila]|nr:hypothetical protein, variant 1 [Exophiala mesophila]KIV92350.1 hypothetical protein, variant 1 [Exophiala mesophila]